jgi:DNA sulfur modification protein DndD
LELQLDSLPDTDIQGLREVRRGYLKQRDRFLQKQSSVDTQLHGLKRQKEEFTSDRNRLLGQQKKGARILAELEVTQDICRVLEGSYERITNEELAKVSELMNKIFLEMIGADPEQGAIIKRAEISREFDIIVYGPNDRTLNPDRDLNGASRRALTLAFILALTKVSEVEAPNVIDTPLGMMSGHVKRLVLRTTIRESSQLVLFLTPSEIAGCDELLDEAAGTVVTLTNTAHYPRMLVNNPGVGERKVLRCECNHREECPLCQRRPDADVVLEMAS